MHTHHGLSLESVVHKGHPFISVLYSDVGLQQDLPSPVHEFPSLLFLGMEMYVQLWIPSSMLPGNKVMSRC